MSEVLAQQISALSSRFEQLVSTVQDHQQQTARDIAHFESEQGHLERRESELRSNVSELSKAVGDLSQKVAVLTSKLEATQCEVVRVETKVDVAKDTADRKNDGNWQFWSNIIAGIVGVALTALVGGLGYLVIRVLSSP